MKKVFHLLVLSIAIGLFFANQPAMAAAATATDFFDGGRKVNDRTKWELPGILTDIAGIKYIGNNRFACIPNEVGTIFIYNTDAGKIEKEIPFSGRGRFEGIAIAGTSAYVVQSDGRIYEVQDFEGATPVVKQYAASLMAKHPVEGLTYDKKNNRLLLVVKGRAPRNNKYKCVYAFDLKSKQLEAKPVVKINLNDPFFAGTTDQATGQTFQPAAIEIHPVTNEIYLLQGTGPQLLVMDTKGHIKKRYAFKASVIPQAAGLAFTPEGELFISNKGNQEAATIVKVVL